MYCRKCGMELSEKNMFCPQCGTEIDPANRKVKGRKNQKYTWFFLLALIIFSCVIIVLAISFVQKFTRQKQYIDSIERADSFFENRKYDRAIEQYQELLTIRPEEAELYRKIAIAHVENEELGMAWSALQLGYTNTGDESLLNVSIWGPLSCYESVLLNEGLPIISRCEYLFSEDSVNGNIYICGTLVASSRYYFSDTNTKVLVGGTLVIYESDLGMSSEVEQMVTDCCEFYSYRCLYNNEGEMEEIREIADEDLTLATMDYKDGKCVYVKSKYGEVAFQYNEMGQIELCSGLPWNSSDSPEKIVLCEYQYDENGDYIVSGTRGPRTDKNWEVFFDKDGLFQKAVVEGEKQYEVKYKEDRRIESIQYQEIECKYDYDASGSVRILIYRYHEKSSEYALEAEKIYKFNSNTQLTDIIYHPPYDGSMGYFESGSYHFEYNEEGQVCRINGIGTENTDEIREYIYFADGRLKKAIIKNDFHEYLYELEYDTYGMCTGYSSNDIVKNEKVSGEDQESYVTGAKDPHEIIGPAIQRLFLVTDSDSGRRPIFIYMVLEEASSGKDNVVSLPCETFLYKSEGNVEKGCYLYGFVQTIEVLNQNYGIWLNDFISISIDKLIEETISQSGDLLDLGITFTTAELEEINNFITMNPNSELMQNAWQKVLKKQVLEREDIPYLCDILGKKNVSSELRKKLGEAFFWLFTELPASHNTFEVMTTSYDEEEFTEIWGKSYADAFVTTVFATKGAYGSLGAGYFPEDAVAFAKKIRFLLLGDNDYIPNENIIEIAENMKKIYLEKRAN